MEVGIAKLPHRLLIDVRERLTYGLAQIDLADFGADLAVAQAPALLRLSIELDELRIGLALGRRGEVAALAATAGRLRRASVLDASFTFSIAAVVLVAGRTKRAVGERNGIWNQIDGPLASAAIRLGFEELGVGFGVLGMSD